MHYSTITTLKDDIYFDFDMLVERESTKNMLEYFERTSNFPGVSVLMTSNMM